MDNEQHISDSQRPGGVVVIPKNDWISVEKTNPLKNGYYIVWCIMPNEPGLVHYHKSTGWQNGFYNDRVTHWMDIIPPDQPKI